MKKWYAKLTNKETVILAEVEISPEGLEFPRGRAFPITKVLHIDIFGKDLLDEIKPSQYVYDYHLFDTELRALWYLQMEVAKLKAEIKSSLSNIENIENALENRT